MTSLVKQDVTFKPGHSVCFGVDSYTDVTLAQQMSNLLGRTMLVTIFISAMDPGSSVKINSFETTVGNNLSERRDLQGVDLISEGGVTLPYTQTFIFGPFHNKPNIEVIITGTVVLGAYASLMETSFSQLSGQNYLEGVTPGVLSLARDLDTGKLVPLPYQDGGIVITPEPGTPFFIRDEVASAAGSKEEVFEFTVPALTTRHLTQLVVTACTEGEFTLENVDTAEILIRIGTTPSNITIPVKFDPSEPIGAGTKLALYFTGNVDTPSVTAFGIAMARDVT